MIDRGECEIRPAHRPPASLEQTNRVGGADLVHDDAVHVEQIATIITPADEVIVPDLIDQGAAARTYSGHPSSRSIGSPYFTANSRTGSSRSASRKPSVTSGTSPTVTVLSNVTRSMWIGGSSQFGSTRRM